MNSDPLVTICLLTHNSEKTLNETLNSILRQTYPNFEILVSDNYSYDKTKEIINYFQKKYPGKIIFRQNLKPIEADQDYIGCYYNYNSCIKSGLIKGDLVSFFHDDDIYDPKIIEKEVKLLVDNPEVGAVFTTADMIDRDGKKVGELGLPKELRRKYKYNFNGIFNALLINGNLFLQTPTFMTKPDIFDKVGLFNELKFRTSADLEMWLKISENHLVSVINENLISWRKLGGGSASYQHLRTERADFFNVMDHYLYQKNLVKKFSKRNLRQYEYQKRFNNTLRATNLLIKGEREEAKKLVSEPFPYSYFLAFFQNFNSKKIKEAVLRLLIKFIIITRTDKLTAKILYKLRYG